MSEPHNTHHHHGQGQPVHRITEAHESHAVEQHSRVLKYTISMTVRLACFIAAFFVDGWLQWFFLAGAIVLPYVAVVIANGGADVTKRQPPAEYLAVDDPLRLAPGPASTVPAPDGKGAEPGKPGADGETYDWEGAGGTVTEPAAANDAPGKFSGAGYPYSPDSGGLYPAEAPTTIDGSFVDDAGDPGNTDRGHHRHGGTP